MINLLDTPGHEDFSEDTYRTLTAVDSALMVLDGGKGVEPRTIALMDVCRLRDTPIVSFINKLDRDIRDPIELLDEIEAVLKIKAAPITGRSVATATSGRVPRPRTASSSSCPAMATNASRHGSSTSSIPTRPARTWAICTTISSSSWSWSGRLPRIRQGRLPARRDDPGLLRHRARQLRRRPCAGRRRRLGSEAAGARRQRAHRGAGRGEIHRFRVQDRANMDPKHRDRIAFMRICSGKYEKGMKMRHVRIKKDLKIADALTFFSSEREMLEEAWAGDIIGLHNHGTIQIGDTFTEGEVLGFTGIPHFAPELFRRVRLKDPLKSKQLRQGLQELAEEGATQVFFPERNNDIILGAVGVLQFDVVASRLKEEYKVECAYEAINVWSARWIECSDEKKLKEFRTRPTKTSLSTAAATSPTAPTRVNLSLMEERWPEVKFRRRASIVRQPTASR